MSRVGLIVQARMGSTRLPGKSLLPLAGEPLVYRILERLKRVSLIDELILAVPFSDEKLLDLGKRCHVPVFLGSENDVLDRYYQAARKYEIDVILRIPADNVASEPEEIDKIINFYKENDFDFCSNLAQVFGNSYPDGIGAEIFSFERLESSWKTELSPEKREHVHLNFFNYVTQKEVEGISVGTVMCPKAFARPDIVLDVNTKNQYEKMSEMYSELYPRNPLFSIMEVIQWWDKNKKKEGFDLLTEVVV